MVNSNETKPNGFKILQTLYELYADQEGIIIHYTIEYDGKVLECSTDKKGKEQWKNKNI